MGNNVDKKFTWVIKDFSSLQSEKIYSDQFLAGGCKWHVLAYPKGNNTSNVLSLYLVVADAEYLPLGWRRQANFAFTIVNQVSEDLSLLKETKHWFNKKEPDWGFTSMFPLAKFEAKYGGFLVNGHVKIIVELEVLEVIGKLDVAEESEVVTQPLKKIEMNDDSAVSSNLPKETLADWVVVNGFQVLPSQVESVKRIFERHPDIALQFGAENQHLRTACMNTLLSLIKTMCQELSHSDLLGAGRALTYVKDSGFKVDWLEEKLEKAKEKKYCEVLVQDYERELEDIKQKCSDKEARVEKEKEELKELKQKCSDKEALLEKEKEELKDLKKTYSLVQGALEEKKAKLLAAIATPLTLDDVL